MDQRVTVLNCFHRLSNVPMRYLTFVKKTLISMSCISRYSTKSSTRENSNFFPSECISTKNVSIEKGSTENSVKANALSFKKYESHVNSRLNELNIQMLSNSLYEQIFCYNNFETSSSVNQVGNGRSFTVGLEAKNELKKLGLWTEKPEFLPDVAMKLPKLRGKNIEEHFLQIGREQSEPYKKLMCDLISLGIPEMPQNWLYVKGWTKYKKGERPESVPFPDEDALVFDVEVCVKAGQAPTMAVAVSSNAWYGWVSSSLTEDTNLIGSCHYTTDLLIPLEGEQKSDRCRIVLGHNVSYDRARVREQYKWESSSLRFMDTMSLHISIGGATRQQKNSIKTNSSDESKEVWKGTACLSSLQDVYAMYCQGEVDKKERDVFVHGSLNEVRSNFQELMSYCANDVKVTYEVFRVLFPIFLERFPHPVTLAGMLEMGMAYLTVNSNWKKYLKNCQEKYEELEGEISFFLSKKCDAACRLMHNEEYKNDLWMWNEDWSTQNLKLTKKKVSPKAETERAAVEGEEEDEELNKLTKKFQHLFDLGEILPKKRPLLPGYPAWYRKLVCRPDSPDWKPGAQSLTRTMTITPKILNLTFENYPLHHIRELGWGILVADVSIENAANTKLPFKKLREIALKNMSSNEFAANAAENGKKSQGGQKGSLSSYEGNAIWCNRMIDDCCYFLKLPHKDGDHKSVGQPLSKSFSTVFSSSNLSCSDSIAEKALRIGNKLSYWRNNRDRILGQKVVWLKSSDLSSDVKQESSIGVIIPQIVVCGTLTRRAVEATWLTAAKANADSLGSELRSLVQAPPGYHFVGADVDSQELWIASLIGDSHFAKIHGSTPFGWMTLSGSKSKGTDMHSVTAKAAGISREHAKVINYARIYGAGVYFAQKLLQQFNPSMTLKDAKKKAIAMYFLTKGRKVYSLKENVREELKASDRGVESFDVGSAIAMARKMGRDVEDIFESRKWKGGTESVLFNELEKIANSRSPATPFLRSRLSRAVEPRFVGDDLHLNTRINWVVQSGAVDFLHIMLVCMRWLTNGRVRFCLSFHDEVRYLVPSELRYQAALALQITNLLTRSFFAYRMGFRDLPLSVAFFSAVDVDKAMRKEASDDCVTPSNPHGLEKEFGISKGESLNIYDVLKKSGGDISAFEKEAVRLELEGGT